MRKLTIIVFLTVITTSSGQFVKENGRLHVEGTQLTNQYGQPLMLRGVSFGWHCLWPRFYNKSAVKWLRKDWNINVIRASMGIELNDMAYIDAPKFSTKKIEAVVKGAIKEGIYVIIDWHSHNINLKEAKDFFNSISKKYGHHPNIIYEIFNEPDEESWQEIKTYSEEIISVIRSNDPDNIILVGSPHWDQDIHLPANDPIKGYANLMYTLHFYAGTHKKWLRDRADEALAKRLPIFVSESAGMEATGDGPIDYEEWQAYINWMEARKISWITWSISDKNETCSMLRPSAKSKGKWQLGQLKESGIKCKEYLKELNR
ncbi:MAG: glycoside hydrolase family 5 protein [Bacteroidota bacterium]|uniref:Glycoside hydrolase family 5 protein n=1 Tax=Flagellimonas profundi TaxID=2915620 RepID=A0ABS3FLU3_9FLAO|nr:glycoside hydrolase family 5 protein [Allomuricauda profundi]MBO0343451.1 glycoside hydrolase family 5 protein [Allomuricauda profundi]MEC7772319.1 glycoside hydrolase family 5 protein [Bacteroidota bacterium]